MQNIKHTVVRMILNADPNSPLAGIDVSENNKFFLWHTWFADVFQNGGFDIVIGNPPYIQLQKSLGYTAIDKKGKEYDVKLGDLYKDAKFATFEKTGDIYCLFYELGNRMLKPGGHLCFITSNKWMRAGYGQSIRNYFSQKTNPKTLIDFGGIQIFDSATVDTNILLFEHADNAHATAAVTAAKHDKSILNNLSDFVRQNAADTSFDTSDSWVILTPIEQSIKRKIESVGVPLKDWDIQINYGIKTGFNDAFIISTEKRDEILANCADEDERERTAELIRPILRGRDIKRYGYDWAGLWLINTHNGIKGKLERIHIEDYPAVKAHLDQYWDKISVRADKGETPYNLRNCAYLDDFNKPKLVWGEISDRSKFAFDESGVYVPEATTFLLVGKDALSLYAFLNSSPAEWYFSKLGPRTGEGTIRWKKYTVEQIFAPKLSEEQIDEITVILSQPIEDIASLMNNWFYSFYELSDDEIAYINGYFNAIVKQK
jgi:type II restriction/modification system DNA methylase subunit YeeA